MKRKLLPLATVLLGTMLSACAVNGAYVMRYGPPPPPRYGMVGVAPGARRLGAGLLVADAPRLDVPPRLLAMTNRRFPAPRLRLNSPRRR